MNFSLFQFWVLGLLNTTILYIQEEIQILLMNYNGNLDSENSYDSKGRLGSDKINKLNKTYL